jgi:hypothetical protein
MKHKWPPIGARALTHEAPDLHLVQRLGHARKRFDAQRRRDLIKELLDAVDADGREHRLRRPLRCVGMKAISRPPHLQKLPRTRSRDSSAVGPRRFGRSRSSQPRP